MQISSLAATRSLASLQRTATTSTISAAEPQSTSSTASISGSTSAAQGTAPLFSNGILNTAAALSPSTLSALFQETSAGNGEYDSNGMPMTKGPLTSEVGVIAEQELQQQSGTQIQGASTMDLTSNDLSLVRAATGYNLNQTSDGFVTLTDDQGNGAGKAEMAQALDMTMNISEDRAKGTLTGDMTATQFGALAAQMQDTSYAFSQPQLNSAYSWLTQEGVPGTPA